MTTAEDAEKLPMEWTLLPLPCPPTWSAKRPNKMAHVGGPSRPAWPMTTAEDAETAEKPRRGAIPVAQAF